MLSTNVLALMLSLSGTAGAVQVRDKAELRTNDSQAKWGDRPNIIWILADDLHYESGIFERMPNLRKLRQEGLEFPNHVSQSPLCGPSRASMLVGRLPHNAGYKRNAEAKSIQAFKKVHDATVGKWLTDVGYYTAFLGKYVNAILRSEKDLPKGWRYFGAFTEIYDFYKHNRLGGAYTYYNTSQWDLSYDEEGTLIKKNNSDYPINIWTDVHQADFLATQTLEHAQEGIKMGRPFFIFTNPTMIHHGYCHFPVEDGTQNMNDPWYEEMQPAQRPEEALGAISPCVKKEHTPKYVKQIVGDFLLHKPGGKNTPSWNKTAQGQKNPPHFGTNCCSSFQEERMAIGRRNRTASLADLDDMLGTIMQGLKHMHVLNNTYVFFTSDNGYHLGEHRFWYGKELPYDHDVRVPMVVRTPAGKRGVRYLPSGHIDITATIVDLSGANDLVTLPLDGLSFAKALTKDLSVMDWRRFSYSEMFEPRGKTWRNLRHVTKAGLADFSINYWCNGDVEVFRLLDSDLGDADEHQLMNCLDPVAGNTSNDWARHVMREWMPVLHGVGECWGQVCNSIDDVQIKTNINYGLRSVFKCAEETNVKGSEVDIMKVLPRHEEGWD